MPAPPATYKRKRRKRESDDIEAALDVWRAFEEESQWKRSKRGNLWRDWGSARVSIFERDDGFYGWCIADSGEPQFSRGGFKSESAAMNAVGEQLGLSDLVDVVEAA